MCSLLRQYLRTRVSCLLRYNKGTATESTTFKKRLEPFSDTTYEPASPWAELSFTRSVSLAAEPGRLHLIDIIRYNLDIWKMFVR